MLLPFNSRKSFFFALFLAMATLAGLSVQARSTEPGKSAHRPAAGKARHSFLSRLPRTNKARKYDHFFLNQLPRQVTAFSNVKALPNAGEPAHDI